MSHTKVCIHADGYAAALNANKQRVKNKEMSFVYDRLTNSTVFQCRKDLCTVTHKFGLGNVAADAASRNHSQRVYLLCASLGIRSVQLAPPESVRSLLRDLAQYVRHLSKVEQMQGRTRSNTEDGDQVALDMARTPTKVPPGVHAQCMSISLYSPISSPQYDSHASCEKRQAAPRGGGAPHHT